jgi:hypothetical protein
VIWLRELHMIIWVLPCFEFNKAGRCTGYAIRTFIWGYR